MLAKNSTAKGIYKWSFPNGKRYLGRASNFRDRHDTYCAEVKKPKKYNRFIHRALRKYGIENCRYEIVEITGNIPDDQIHLKETLWIKYYDSANPKFGYNILAIGGSNAGFKHSLKTKEKMRLARVGKPLPTPKGSKLSLERIKRIKEMHKFFTPEQLEKRKETARKNAIHFNKFRERNQKPVNQLTLNGDFIKSWVSATEAARILRNALSGNIRTAIRKNGTAYGYKWEYSKEII